VSHLRRPALSRQHPVHVTLRVQRGVVSLRSGSGPALFPAVRAALAAGKERGGFRLVHFSVQRDHLHLLAEANDRRALARGIQGLSIRVAKAVNRRLGRKGRLFAERYHARALKTPRACRLAARYVLLNARKHERAPGEARRRAARGRRGALGSLGTPSGFIDGCSSAAWFAGFSRPAELVFGVRRCRAAWERVSGSSAPPVALPRTWLLRVGLVRAGPFDVDDVPGS
jgi:REP element-mobilizing transposase RayT